MTAFDLKVIPIRGNVGTRLRKLLENGEMDATVRAARAALAGVPLAQRVHERLLRRAREQLAGDQSLAELASPAATSSLRWKVRRPLASMANASAILPTDSPDAPACTNRRKICNRVS